MAEKIFGVDKKAAATVAVMAGVLVVSSNMQKEANSPPPETMITSNFEEMHKKGVVATAAVVECGTPATPFTLRKGKGVMVGSFKNNSPQQELQQGGIIRWDDPDIKFALPSEPIKEANEVPLHDPQRLILGAIDVTLHDREGGTIQGIASC